MKYLSLNLKTKYPTNLNYRYHEMSSDTYEGDFYSDILIGGSTKKKNNRETGGTWLYSIGDEKSDDHFAITPPDQSCDHVTKEISM